MPLSMGKSSIDLLSVSAATCRLYLLSVSDHFEESPGSASRTSPKMCILLYSLLRCIRAVFVLYPCCMVGGVEWGGWIVEVVSCGVCHADHITAPRVSCLFLCAVMFWIGSPTDCISG